MGKVKAAYITFDVDFVNYLDDREVDEMDEIFDVIKNALIEYPEVKTTWFIRIDGQIEQQYGSADYLYNKHQDKIDWLKDNGHVIGWHHHAYRLANGKWVQNLEEEIILGDLEKYGKIALSKGLKVCRMGWGYHTNNTMKMVADLGFIIDSSAIPRPNYKWEMSVKDWQTTKQQWYKPSAADYRVEGAHSLSITEVPINTAVLPLPTDTEANVIRYINPAYNISYFESAINGVQDLGRLVTITHPYELIDYGKQHVLLSFNINKFKNNLTLLKTKRYQFYTIQ